MQYHASIASAKGAIEGLTRSLAAEFAPSIRVNCIAPSITNTPLAEKLLNNEAKLKASEDRHPLKRIGSAKEISELVSFLLSENSGFITGQIIKADGGISSVKTL
jgi:NAD(P)-dependent dehydrogenase (short-subunit alcohol dehydrogenase family)